MTELFVICMNDFPHAVVRTEEEALRGIEKFRKEDLPRSDWPHTHWHYKRVPVLSFIEGPSCPKCGKPMRKHESFAKGTFVCDGWPTCTMTIQELRG